MANYYRVSPKFWLWARRRALTDAQTSLAFYLLTCTHRNLEGLYRLPKPYIGADLAWQPKKVDETLAVVLETGFAMYDEDAEMLLIPKALKHQAPNTANQITGAIAQLRRIPRTSLWHAFRMACASHCPKLAEAIDKEWPSDQEGISHVRAGSPASACAGPSSSSSSISSSTSTPPQPPEQARGEHGVQEDASPGLPKNSRAAGTNPRAVALAALNNMTANVAAAAAAALATPNDEQRTGWERLRATMQTAVGEDSSTWALYAEGFSLAGVDDDALVLDGPEQTWRWVRGQAFIAKCSESSGVAARLTSLTEHEGLAAGAAA